MYMLNSLECHHKVVTTSGKLYIFFKPRVFELGLCQQKKTCQIIFFCNVQYNCYIYKILYYCAIILEYIIIQFTSRS